MPHWRGGGLAGTNSGGLEKCYLQLSRLALYATGKNSDIIEECNEIGLYVHIYWFILLYITWFYFYCG